MNEKTRAAFLTACDRIKKQNPRMTLEQVAEMASRNTYLGANVVPFPPVQSDSTPNDRGVRPGPWFRWITDLPTKGGKQGGWLHVPASEAEVEAVRAGLPVSYEMSLSELVERPCAFTDKYRQRAGLPPLTPPVPDYDDAA